MQPSSSDQISAKGHAAISEVAGIKEQTIVQRVLASQPFWVGVALILLVSVMTTLLEN